MSIVPASSSRRAQVLFYSAMRYPTYSGERMGTIKTPDGPRAFTIMPVDSPIKSMLDEQDFRNPTLCRPLLQQSRERFPVNHVVLRKARRKNPGAKFTGGLDGAQRTLVG